MRVVEISSRFCIEMLEHRRMLSGDLFLKAAGTIVRDGHGTGDPILLQGTNIGSVLLSENWSTPRDSSGTLPDDWSQRMKLIERFGQARADQLLSTFGDAWITTSDFRRIKSLGMNVVRLPFFYQVLQNEDGTWRADAFDKIDWLVHSAWSQGIYTILDFHGLWGGQSTSQTTGRVRSTAEFWKNSLYQQRSIDIWTALAAHYVGNPAIAAYDLINEPWGAPSNSALWSMYDRMYDAIRAVDPDHMISMEAQPTTNAWNTLPNPSTYAWTNVIYQPHEYQFDSSTNQAAVMAGTDSQVADFKAHLSWNVPCLVGEFNDFGWTGWTPVWNYTIQQFQKNNMSWTEWEYKANSGSAPNSWGIWDPVSPRPPTPNLLTDSFATIQSDWAQWTTDNAFSLNTMLEPALTVSTRNAFNNEDIGSTTQTGSAAYDNTKGIWTLNAAGAGIGGTADQFQFVSMPVSGDLTLVTKITGVENVNASSKAGVMFRNTTAGNSMMAAITITAGSGVTFQWRSTIGAAASSATVAGVVAPQWVKLVRTGNVFNAFYSSDNVTWTQLGTAQTIAMADSARAGLVVTSSTTAATCTATATNFSMLPVSMADADIGNTTHPGSVLFDGHNWIVSASGSDIWGTADNFHYASVPFTGDGSLIARVDAQQYTDSGAKIGLMFRESTAANSRYADIIHTPNGTIYFQWRTSTGGNCGTAQASSSIALPVWLKITRVGNSFSGYYSTNGTTWIKVGNSVTVGMSSAALGGIAMTARTNSQDGTAVLSNLSLLKTPPTIATAAAASPSVVTATSTSLSVLGAFAAGESNLIYNWRLVDGPDGVTFSANGTNAAKNCTATFSAAGVYAIEVRVTDPTRTGSVVSTVNVTVNQSASSVQVTPFTATVEQTTTQQFTARQLDQFGHPMSVQPAFTWSVSAGIGSINTSGLYTAPSSNGSATILATVGAMSDTSSVTVIPEPIAYYSFEEGAGTTISDSSGNGYTGTASGTTWARGQYEGGLTFDGTTSTVNIGSPAGLNITGQITLMAWIKPTTTAGTQDIIGRSYNLTPKQELVLRIGSGQYQVGSWDGANYMAVSTMPSTDVNNWVHLAGTYDGTSWKLYRNGVLVNTFTTAVGAINVAKNWCIGSGDGVGRYFSGGIDEVRIYNTALTAAQITAAMAPYNQAPTIATNATVSPNPVNSTSAALSVLGADDSGESNLAYNWSVVGTPSADVIFSANGTNSAKTVTATFRAPGTYTLAVTASDPLVRTVTSVITFNASLSSITGTSGADIIRIARNGANVDFYLNDLVTPIYTSPFASQGAIAINGLGGSDTIQLIGLSTAGTTTFSTAAINFEGLSLSYSNIESIQYDGLLGGDTLSVNSGLPVQLTASQTLASLTIANGASVVLPVNGNIVLDTISLNLNSTGKLDLNDNAMIVRTTGALPSITTKILTGQNGFDNINGQANWNGNGIISSAARTQNLLAGVDYIGIGAIRNASLDDLNGPGSRYTTWKGRTVGAEDVLIRYTYLGDADMNGTVTIDDYNLVDGTVLNLFPNKGWVSGNFDYTGSITIDDYNAIDTGYLYQAGSLDV